LIQAHSHNDYEQAQPLFDALKLGFCNIEADIHLIEGKLLVAHTLERTHPDKTLESLYLNPLRERSRQNGGRVYRNGPTVTLLIDIKTDAEKTYAALRPVLYEYREVLTVFQSAKIITNAVTVVISGNRPRQTMASEAIRYAAFDGRIEDLDSLEPASFLTWISDNWQLHFTWRGVGPFPDREKEKLNQIVKKAHERGRKLRFWGTPDQPVVWRELLGSGVDIIITDDLALLQNFLEKDR
jgi:glycerophosphoryl diester phosphodiesterase